eukprot:7142045-Pyramimonas_sp.AAC.1
MCATVSRGPLGGMMVVRCLFKWCWKTGSFGRGGPRCARVCRRFRRRVRGVASPSANRRCTAWWSEPRSGHVVANESRTKCRAC